MHIRKYDFDYGRRMLLEKLAGGAFSAGVLSSLWPLIANADDTTKAYPEELTDIEANTKGKIKVGDVLTENNVDHVKHLLDPITYDQVKTQGRRIHIVAPIKDVTTLFPPDHYDATVRNAGKAAFDKNGNVVEKATGGPWIGGNPFPDIQNGDEAIANLTLSWGRHNYSQYAIRDWDINPDGTQAYQYDFVWTELATQARTGPEKVFRDFKDLLRLNTVFFTSPVDQAGASFLSTWYYDQRKYPELDGYMPLFRRVRQFPTNQRFEPLVPGITMFLSDAWAAGDPMLTWGNYKVVSREPALIMASGQNWFWGKTENGKPPVHGGPKGETFWDTYMELCPETVVFEAEPTGYPRAPVGKKKVWVDVRNGNLVSYVTYDRRGELWKTIQVSFGPKDNGVTSITKNGRPEWSWHTAMLQDVQSGRMSRFYCAPTTSGGYKTVYEADENEVYDKFLTRKALVQLGAV